MCVCMCLSGGGCVCFALLMFQSVTPSLLSTFLLHCSWIIALILYICCVTVTPVHRRVYKCVWVDVLVLHSWCFRVSPRHCGVLFFCIVADLYIVHTKLCRIFVFLSISHSFPMVSYFWPKTTSVTIVFYDHLACSNQALNFFCVHIPNAIKVIQFRTILMKLWF